MARYTLMHSGKKLSAMAATTSAELAGVISDKVGTGPLSFGGREVLTAARTYYVRTDGSDSNTGLADTAGGAFLTIQRAVNVASGTLDCRAYNATIQVADGTYAETVDLKPCIGTGVFTITGNTTTPSSCVVAPSGNNAGIACTFPGSPWKVQGFKIYSGGSGSLVSVASCAILQFGVMEFGATTGQQIAMSLGAYVQMLGNWTISGGAARFLYAVEGAIFRAHSLTCTLTGTPAFSSQFLFATGLSQCRITSITFSGSATGARYLADTNSHIQTGGGGATYLPGNASGSVTNGGIYL